MEPVPVPYNHSWAPLTENLAGEKRKSLIANSDLAQLNGKTLKCKCGNGNYKSC